MPGGDGTGPEGRGGWCTPFWRGGRIQRPIGRGFFGRGGRGRGFRRMYYATGLPRWARNADLTEPTAEDETGWLEEQAKLLEEELKQTRTRITELRE